MNMANPSTRHNRMELVTEKEHRNSPKSRKSLEGMPPESLEVSMIKHLFKTPPEKQALPLTSSQEMSWLLTKHVRPETFRRHAMASEAVTGVMTGGEVSSSASNSRSQSLAM